MDNLGFKERLSTSMIRKRDAKDEILFNESFEYIIIEKEKVNGQS